MQRLGLHAFRFAVARSTIERRLSPRIAGARPGNLFCGIDWFHLGVRAIRALTANVFSHAFGCLALLAVGQSALAQDQDASDVRYAERMPLADEALVLDAAPTSFGAIAVGARGHVLLTEDFETWHQAERVPTRATLTAVDVVGEAAWAVGHDSVIIHSSDGGTTWDRQMHAPEREQPFLDVLFLDESHGLAVGAYGLLMETRDGGGTWTEGSVSDTDDWHLNAITVAQDGAIFIAAERGIIYRSTDGGRTWTSVDLPYEGSMFDIFALPDGEVMAVGLRGHAFRTVDGGETWNPVQTGTESSLHGGRILQGGRLIVVGGNGVVLERERAGSSFSELDYPSDEPLAGVIAGAGGELIYYGLNGIQPAEATREES